MVARDYEARKREGGGKFGANGLKARGKLFALLVRGRLVVKLPRARVDEMVAAGRGAPFDTGRGRVMKEWVVITSPRAAWIELAREAFAFVAGAAK